MHAAAAGKSTLGIPKKVGQEFVAADDGGKLPAHKASPNKKKPKLRIGRQSYGEE